MEISRHTDQGGVRTSKNSFWDSDKVLVVAVGQIVESGKAVRLANKNTVLFNREYRLLIRRSVQNFVWKKPFDEQTFGWSGKLH